MNELKQLFLCLSFYLLFAISAMADIPNNYYAGVEDLTGAELKTRLHGIIKNHTEYSYREVWDLLSYTDEDLDNPDNVKLLYSGWTLPKSSHGGNPSQWNREHVWAKSHGQFGKRPPAGTDLHHLRPTDVTVNSRRGNLDFDNGGELYTDGDGATQCRVDSDSWEPPNSVKGDIARMIFYMAVRYEGGDGAPDLELADNVSNNKKPLHGKLSTLLIWHQQDPVDDWERRRNDRIYEKQHNRNPFIDHPEFVNLIWGNPKKENNSIAQHEAIRVGTFNIAWYPYRNMTDYEACCVEKNCSLPYQTDEDALWEVIQNTKADLLIVQEIVKPERFAQFIAQKSNNSFSFAYDSRDIRACQKIGFLYNKEQLELIGNYEHLDSISFKNGEPRYRPAYHAFFKSKQGGFDFHAIGLHLASSSATLEFRKNQWQKLIEAIQASEVADNDIIIAGDFNAFDNGKSYQAILDELRFVKITEQTPSYCYNDKYSYLDNILVSPSIFGNEFKNSPIQVYGGLENLNGSESQNCDDYQQSAYRKNVSDHCPVVATFVDFDNDPEIDNSNPTLFRADEAPSPSIAYTGKVIGNKNSRIFHHPTKAHQLPKESNQVIFESVAEAKSAGYRAAKNYNWGE